MDKIEIYTDGAAKGNPGPGGYGVILRSGRFEKELSQGFYYTTNNRMELLAVIVGLETLKKKGNRVSIFSDSKYVVDPVNKKWLDQWQKKSWSKVKNVDLWKRLIIALRDQKVSFFWIKGHNEHTENERCDKLAVMASKSPTLEDRGYLKG